MISCIITSYKEPTTIGKAIEALLEQTRQPDEIIVCAPDKETLAVAKMYATRFPHIVTLLKDPGKGKPTALNLCFKKVKGTHILLTDGDVQVSKNSIEELIKPFHDSPVGAVTGRVHTSNDKNTKWGFWAYILTEGFHLSRLNAHKKKRFMVCSGYLYMIQRGLVKAIPPETWADDAYISYAIAAQGKTIKYAPRAAVYVKSPTNLKDWVKQKKRTAARFYQLKQWFSLSKTASFFEEIGLSFKLIGKIRSLKQGYWYDLLLGMKLYIWMRVFLDRRLWKQSSGETWQRIESTK